MEHNLIDIIKNSGDAKIQKLLIKNNILEFELANYDEDFQYAVKVEFSTITIRGDIIDSNFEFAELSLVTFEQLNINEFGIIIPNKDFIKFMSEVRNSINLIYGCKIGEQQILKVSGIKTSIYCLIENLDKINWISVS